MSEVLSLAEAERLAERVLAAIDNNPLHSCLECPELTPYILERVASDLAGLREHVSDGFHPTMEACEGDGHEWPCSDARRYSDNLRLTARIYGVQEET